MRSLNPTLLTIGAFHWFVLAVGAQAQQTHPTYYPPSFSSQGFPGSAMNSQYRGKPLPDTVYGQPIDSTQSADAVLNYVQKEVESRVRVSPGGTRQAGYNTIEVFPPTLDLSSALRNAMAPILAKFGADNLQKALKLGTQPRTVDGDMNNTADILKGYEASIIQAALALAQGGGSPNPVDARPLNQIARATVPDSPPVTAIPTPPPVPPAAPDPAPPVVANPTPAVVPPPVTAPLQTATVTAQTKIETHTASGGYAALPLDVGDQLTILSVNPDGTVTAEAKYHFHGTVLQSAIHLNPATP